MSTQEFFNKYNGKTIDFDGWYGTQCSDLAQQYNKEMYNGPFLTGEAAADLWDTFPVDYYERVLNTPEAIPLIGDLIIWKKTTSLPFGHVGIFNEGDINRFTSFDQNWIIGTPCHIQEHDYTGVIGWFHPIKEMADDALATCLTQHTQLVDKCNSLEKQVLNLQTENEANLAHAKTDCDVLVSNQRTELLIASTNERKALEEEIKKLQNNPKEIVKVETSLLERFRGVKLSEKIKSIIDILVA